MRSLVVEDNFTNRQLMMRMLSPFGRSDVAVNGKEAVSAFRQAYEESSPYNLICLDIMMPEMDGHEALAEIRKIEQERDISPDKRTRVLMTTAVDAPGSKQQAQDNACDGYLLKPIMKMRLYEELEKIGLISPEQLSAFLTRRR